QWRGLIENDAAARDSVFADAIAHRVRAGDHVELSVEVLAVLGAAEQRVFAAAFHRQDQQPDWLGFRAMKVLPAAGEERQADQRSRNIRLQSEAVIAGHIKRTQVTRKPKVNRGQVSGRIQRAQERRVTIAEKTRY